jgi:hypothetical protein
VEALKGRLGGHLGVIGDEGRVRYVGNEELVLEALGVGEVQRAVATLRRHALAAQALGPEPERVLRADAPDHPVDHPVAVPAARDPGVVEEREVAAGVAAFVGVEQVVDGGVVLVDRLLHEAQTHHARVEVDVRRRIGRDRGDVMDPLELHVLRGFPKSAGR